MARASLAQRLGARGGPCLGQPGGEGHGARLPPFQCHCSLLARPGLPCCLCAGSAPCPLPGRPGQSWLPWHSPHLVHLPPGREAQGLAGENHGWQPCGHQEKGSSRAWLPGCADAGASPWGGGSPALLLSRKGSDQPSLPPGSARGEGSLTPGLSWPHSSTPEGGRFPGVKVRAQPLSHRHGQERRGELGAREGTMGAPSSATPWPCSPVVRHSAAQGGRKRLAAMLGGCGVVALESPSQVGSQAACGVPHCRPLRCPSPSTRAVLVGSRGAALEENLSSPALSFLPRWCLGSLLMWLQAPLLHLASRRSCLAFLCPDCGIGRAET